MARKKAQTSADSTLQQTQNDGDSKNVSGYEQFREERIKENLERMQKLGILDLSLQFKSVKPSQKSAPFTRKTPLRVSPLPPSGPTRRSSRLQNATPVSYSEVKLGKKDKSLEEEDDLLKEVGSKPEIYTEEHEKLLGSTEQTWTLFVDGCGKDGKRIYDPVSGKTCHQCRQKTLGHRTHCSKCNMVQGQFCGDCLYMRYGEHVLEAKQNPNWICPVCRGICNCSLCRQAKGWPPTGALYRKISSLGYKSVAHYLIQTRRAKTGCEIDLSSKAPLSTKRSLPFEEIEAPSSEKESSQLNNPQGLLNHHSEDATSEKNLVEETEQGAHCSVNELDNCKLASESTTELIPKPELTFDTGYDLQELPKPEPESNETKNVLQHEKEKEMQLVVYNGTKNVLQYGQTPAPEKTPPTSKKRARTTDLVADSIAGRLRQRRGKNSEHEDSNQDANNRSSPVKADATIKCSNVTSPNTESIAGRLKQRGRT